jgi:hypothetical protein
VPEDPKDDEEKSGCKKDLLINVISSIIITTMGLVIIRKRK